MRISSDYRALGRGALRGKWGSAIGAALLAALLGGAVGFIANGGSQMQWNLNDHGSTAQWAIGPLNINIPQTDGFWSVLMLLYMLVCVVIGGAITVGYAGFNLRLLRGENPTCWVVLDWMPVVWKALGLRLLTGLLVALGTLLLIVPGIILGYRYSMAYYVMAENPDMGICDAMSESGRIMVGNKFRLFCLHLSFIGWSLLCVFTAGIGYLWLMPYMGASEAAFYLDVSGQAED